MEEKKEKKPGGKPKKDKSKFRYMVNMKNGKYAPKFADEVKRAIQISGTERNTFTEYLSNKGIDTIFRENEAGRIYGVTFVDHTNKEVYNGSRLGKEFSANNFNKLFNESINPFSFQQEPASKLLSDNRNIQDTQEEHNTVQQSKADQLVESFGIFSLEQHGPDYEEEAFIRRMKKKKNKLKGRSL